jgi:predicted metalloprotease with PDZ domain
MNTFAEAVVVGTIPHWVVPTVVAGICLGAIVAVIVAIVFVRRDCRKQAERRRAKAALAARLPPEDPLVTLDVTAQLAPAQTPSLSPLDESNPSIDMFKDVP